MRPAIPEAQVLVQLSLGAVFVVLSAVLHVAALDQIAIRVRAEVDRRAVPLPARIRLGLLMLALLGTFLSNVLQIWIWAMVYLAVDEFDHLEPALYFSTVVFTTLGFGDIVPTPDWRLTASCEAAAGMLLFGLSTAFLFEMVRMTFRRGP